MVLSLTLINMSNVLSGLCICVRYMHAWCPQRPEAGIGSPVVRIVVNYYIGAGN